MNSVEHLDCASLQPGSVIDVETRSRHYRIECLGGHAIRVSGHPKYCPTPVEAELEGSVNSDGTLDSGMIERGGRLLLLLEEHRPVTTSKVLDFHVDSGPAPASNGSSRVH